MSNHENSASVRNPYDFRHAFLIFFFCSGACGLIYEVVWTKLLGQVMSNTVYSISTVLTAFMGGLALGSWVAGRLVDKRKDPLFLYGLLEFLIGLYCLALPTFIDWTYPVYSSFYRDPDVSFYELSLIRFLMCGGILLIPTALMGATLPILSKYFVVSQNKVGVAIANLYSANTFGAVAGACLTGFVLIPAFGLWHTILMAALINMFIGSTAIYLHYREKKHLQNNVPPIHEVLQKENAEESAAVKPLSKPMLYLTLSVFLISGFCAMVYQVVWNRTSAMMLGTSTYSFTLVVTAFILGLGVGSSLLGRLADRIKRPAFALGLVQVGIGVLCIFISYLLGRLPIFLTETLFRDTTTYVGVGYYMLLFREFLILFILILVPTMLMGATFPLVAKLCTGSLNSVGKSIGTAYAWNTIGAILGSFMGGFILMPMLGMEASMLVTVSINILAGLILIVAAEKKWRFNSALAGILLCLVCFNFVYQTPRWNINIMSAGVYYYGESYYEYAQDSNINLEDSIKEDNECLFYKEGLTCTVAVYEYNGNKYYRTNGKVEASTRHDMPTQVLVAQIPLLLHQNPQDALLIGLGGGMTLGSIRQHDALKRIDCVEISQEVVQGAWYFRDSNHGTYFDHPYAERPRIPGDPRVELIVGDGRNHVALTDRQYDVIISEPSNPWIAGLSSLFSYEFYQQVKPRLREKGIFCQWIHSYSMVPEDFNVAVTTFLKSFPYTQMWQSPGGSDYFMIGSLSPLTFDFTNIKERLDNSQKLSSEIDLVLSQGETEESLERVFNIASCYLTDRKGMYQIATLVAERNTDDNCYLEYHAPRNLYANWDISSGIYNSIEMNISSLDPYVVRVSDSPEVTNRVKLRLQCMQMERRLNNIYYDMEEFANDLDPNKPKDEDNEDY